jgi:hypothetical protein
MVWASTVLLLLAAFPTILQSVKKFKIKDFEVELASELERAAEEAPLTVMVDERFSFDTKGAAPELARLLRKAASDPGRPVILDVDIGQGDRISIVMLHTYVALLELVSNPVLIVFRSGAHLHGTVRGARLARVLRREFPMLWEFFKGAVRMNEEAEVGGHTSTWLRDAVAGRLEEGKFTQLYYADNLHSQVLTLEHFARSVSPELHPAWVHRVDGTISVKQVAEWLGNPEVDWLIVLEAGTPVGLLNLCMVARRAVEDR